MTNAHDDDFRLALVEIGAQGLAVDAGALSRCPVHEDEVLATGRTSAVADACARARRLIAEDRLHDLVAFAQDLGEIVRAIESQVAFAPAECPRCRRWRDVESRASSETAELGRTGSRPTAASAQDDATEARPAVFAVPARRR